nr:MAG TPA: hypothetical protein [Caudoviricetes sp.]
MYILCLHITRRTIYGDARFQRSFYIRSKYWAPFLVNE